MVTGYHVLSLIISYLFASFVPDISVMTVVYLHRFRGFKKVQNNLRIKIFKWEENMPNFSFLASIIEVGQLFWILEEYNDFVNRFMSVNTVCTPAQDTQSE